MDDIDALLADEGFCQSLLSESVVDCRLMDDLKAEQDEQFCVSPSTSLQAEGEENFLDTFDSLVMMNGSVAEPAMAMVDGNASGSGEEHLEVFTDAMESELNALTYLDENLQSSPQKSSGQASPQSNYHSNSNNSDSGEHYDVSLDDLDLDEDSDSVSGGKQRGPTRGGSKKPPLFQSLRSNGELRLTELERQTLAQEGHSIQTRLPLSKHDERILKQVRRKIRNKISAQESRRKKRAYVDQLESHLHNAERENRELRAQLRARSDALRKVSTQFSSLRAFVSRHIRFDVPSSNASANNNSSSKSASGLHPKPTVMALFLCFAVLVGCRPEALHSAGFFFSNTSQLLQSHNRSNSSSHNQCQIALITYGCNADTTNLEDYYFDGRSFLDHNAASLRTLKRFSDQSNMFRHRNPSLLSRSRSAIDPLLNALRYSTARTLFRRTVAATSGKLANLRKNVHQPSSVPIAPVSHSLLDSQSSVSNGKLLDERAAPARTLLFKWSMNGTAVSGWWNNVLRTFVDESCCSNLY